MKTLSKQEQESLLQISLPDFLVSYNKNIPPLFPKATAALLQKFKNSHETLFRHGELWSLDQHRKKIIDWLPLNRDAA